MYVYRASSKQAELKFDAPLKRKIGSLRGEESTERIEIIEKCKGIMHDEMR